MRVLPNTIIRPAYDVQDLTSTSHLPRSIYCPITCMPMVDPVVAADGHSYERAAILKWFERGTTRSPVTGATLSHTRVLSNHTLRCTIAELIPPPSDQDDTNNCPSS